MTTWPAPLPPMRFWQKQQVGVPQPNDRVNRCWYPLSKPRWGYYAGGRVLAADRPGICSSRRLRGYAPRMLRLLLSDRRGREFQIKGQDQLIALHVAHRLRRICCTYGQESNDGLIGKVKGVLLMWM